MVKRIRSWLWRPFGDLPEFTTHYDERYVNALLAGLRRAVTPPWRLELWVDQFWLEKLMRKFSPSEEQLSLTTFSGADAGGWSHMMEIFRPRDWPKVNERILAVGLDTIFTGNCDWLFQWDSAPCGWIRDPLSPETITNAVMTFDRQGAERMWDANIVGLAEDYKNARIFGLPSEMMLMRSVWKLEQWPLLEERPERLLSYKVHVMGSKESPPWRQASIVYTHGNPKPHELSGPLREFWDGGKGVGSEQGHTQENC